MLMLLLSWLIEEVGSGSLPLKSTSDRISSALLARIKVRSQVHPRFCNIPIF